MHAIRIFSLLLITLLNFSTNIYAVDKDEEDGTTQITLENLTNAEFMEDEDHKISVINVLGKSAIWFSSSYFAVLIETISHEMSHALMGKLLFKHRLNIVLGSQAHYNSHYYAILGPFSIAGFNPTLGNADTRPRTCFDSFQYSRTLTKEQEIFRDTIIDLSGGIGGVIFTNIASHLFDAIGLEVEGINDIADIYKNPFSHTNISSESSYMEAAPKWFILSFLRNSLFNQIIFGTFPFMNAFSLNFASGSVGNLVSHGPATC